MTDDLSLKERVRRERDRHPDAGVVQVAGAIGADPEAVADVLDEDTGGDPSVSSEDAGDRLTGSQIDPDEDLPTLDAEPGVWAHNVEDYDCWMPWQRLDGRKQPHAIYANDVENAMSWSDPDCWRSAEQARMACVDDRMEGPGIILQHEDNPYADWADPFFVVDYDDVRDPKSGDVHPVVVEHVEAADSYADVSTSGTGVHIIARGSLPDDVKTIQATLPDHDAFPGAEIEVYDGKRFVAMTGDHIVGTPTEATDAQGFLDDLVDEFVEDVKRRDPTDTPHPDGEDWDLEYDAGELADLETTTDIQAVFDACRQADPRDIRLRSDQTEERSDGTLSFDPSWEQSRSGTRLGWSPDVGWIYRKGDVGLDAIQVVALEERLITSPHEYPEGETWWRAVEALRDRGARIPEYEHPESGGRGEAEHTAVLPPAMRDLSTATSGWDWTQHSRTADADLSIDNARERCRDAIEHAYDRGDQVLVEALPTLGKSYGSIAAAADADEQVAVFTGRGREEQYDQLADWCEEHGLTYNVLPSFTELCDTATGEFGADAQERVLDWYRRGATPQEIHKHGVPCQHQDGHECPYTAAWRGAYEDHTGDEYDVLIGYYNHAHNDEVVQGRTVVFDEFPGGAHETQLDHLLAPAVSYFVQAHDDIPFDDYADLLEHRDDEARRADALTTLEEMGVAADETLVFEDSQVHAAAPLATFTILAGPGDDLGNGWERSALGDAGVGLFDREEGRVHLLQPPDFDYTSGIVALDGTPTKRMWELTLGSRFSSHRQILTDEERREYISDVLNLSVVQTTDAMKPYNSADHVAVDQDAALLEGIRDEHGQRPSVITTTTAEHEYDQAGLLDEYIDETKHYGNVLGSKEFDDTRLGAVIGSTHYGDRYIEKWGALAGRRVERGDEKGAELSYGQFGDQILTHMREHEVLQAAMRFGRDGNGAVVYVHTAALPDWVPRAGHGRVVTTWSDGMCQVLAAAEDLQEWTTDDLAEHPDIDVGRRQVLEHLERLRSDGVVERGRDPDDGRRFVWQADGLHRVGEHGEVDLEPVEVEELDDDEVSELARSSFYTWEFVQSASITGGCQKTLPDHGDVAPAQSAKDGDSPSTDTG